MSTDPIEPVEVVLHVERYVEEELSDAQKYDNRELLDESGVWSLHRLAAEVYAMGYRAGEQATTERARRANSRAKEKAATA